MVGTKIESAYIIAKDTEGNVIKVNLEDPCFEFNNSPGYTVAGGGGLNYPIAIFDHPKWNFTASVATFQLLRSSSFEITDDELITLLKEGETNG